MIPKMYQKIPEDKKINAGKNPQGNQPQSTRFLEKSDDPVKLKTINSSLRAAIIEWRVKKQWSQKELADKSNIQLRIIKEYENGTGVVNNSHINTLQRTLGVYLTGVKAGQPYVRETKKKSTTETSK